MNIAGEPLDWWKYRLEDDEIFYFKFQRASWHLWAYRAKLATLTLAAGHTLGQILKKDGIRSYFNSFADVDTDDAQGVWDIHGGYLMRFGTADDFRYASSDENTTSDISELYEAENWTRVVPTYRFEQRPLF